MTERLGPLPVRVRPRPGEHIASFVRRLARANHLKPSYLHMILSGPPNWFGAPQPDRLAALSGISELVLQRTLARPSSELIVLRPEPGQSEAERSRAQLLLRIRRDGEGRGLTVRSLAARHQASRRTVRKALNTPEPSPEVITCHRPRVVERHSHLIDPMLEEGGLLPKQIWVRLIDDHDITIGFTLTFIVNYAREWHLAKSRVVDASFPSLNV